MVALKFVRRRGKRQAKRPYGILLGHSGGFCAICREIQGIGVGCEKKKAKEQKLIFLGLRKRRLHDQTAFAARR
jgi:hypothetical protein